MKPITHPIYKDYPEQPYISPRRDLELWIQKPEKFPYGIVEKKQMVRLPEGILPGHLIMLWRIHFGNFTNESVIPRYFEYRYGIESKEAIQTLLDLGFITIGSAEETLPLMNMQLLKRILEQNHLSVKGKKQDLIDRIIDEIESKKLESLFTLRKYNITDAGTKVLNNHDDIIQKHGPKM